MLTISTFYGILTQIFWRERTNPALSSESREPLPFIGLREKPKWRENTMKLMEIIDRIDEMAFKRRAIIDKLRALQTSINSHALKIIVYPDAQEVPHWKRELVAWGNDLAAMQLRGFRGVTPMGVTLAWNGLYREPFEGAEDRVLQLKLGQIEHEYQRPITRDRRQIMAELTRFLRSYCEVIGQSQFVDSAVDALVQPARLPETAAE